MVGKRFINERLTGGTLDILWLRVITDRPFVGLNQEDAHLPIQVVSRS